MLRAFRVYICSSADAIFGKQGLMADEWFLILRAVLEDAMVFVVGTMVGVQRHDARLPLTRQAIG